MGWRRRRRRQRIRRSAAAGTLPAGPLKPTHTRARSHTHHSVRHHKPTLHYTYFFFTFFSVLTYPPTPGRHRNFFSSRNISRLIYYTYARGLTNIKDYYFFCHPHPFTLLSSIVLVLRHVSPSPGRG